MDKLHRQLSLLARRYQLRSQQETLAFGLSVSEGYALGILTEHPALTMGELAEYLNLSLAATTKIVKKLCQLKLATKIVDGTDKRVQLVSTTIMGQKSYTKLQVQFKRHLQKSFKKFSVKDIEIIADGLENINTSIDVWRELRSKQTGDKS